MTIIDLPIAPTFRWNDLGKGDRILWRLDKIRASDLRTNDMMFRAGLWVDVLETYFDVEDPETLAAAYDKENPQLARVIRERLDTVFNLHVLVRFVNVAKSDGDNLESDHMWLLAHELVDVQVPHAIQKGPA
jgi:hypothetical protein